MVSNCSVFDWSSGRMARALSSIVLAGALSSSAALAQAPGLSAEERADTVEALADALVERYVDPDRGMEMADALRASLAAGDYDDIASGQDFAETLQRQLFGIVGDGHLAVSYAPYGVGAAPPAEAQAALDRMARTARGFVPRVEILRGDIGYIEVDAMPPGPGFAAAVDAAFALVARTQALVIDMRASPGGDPGSVTLLASYLLDDAPRLLQTVHWREGDGERVEELWTSAVGEAAYGESRPVAVLISSFTASGGEGFAYHMQAFERAVLVGETTRGAGLLPAPGAQAVLGPSFSASIPSGRPVHPVTGGGWEGVGVIPDIEIPQADALERAQVALFERLADSEAEPAMRGAWRGYAESLEAELASHGGPSIPVAELEGEYDPVANGRFSFTATAEPGGGLRVTMHSPDGYVFRLHHDGGDRYTADPLVPGARIVYAFTFRRENGAIRAISEPHVLEGRVVLRERPPAALFRKR